jgi:putative SOS response-associated peptidase YedK
VFAFAGLYDTWNSPEGTALNTYTIITTTPNSLMAPIHDRMPVILLPEDEARWMSPEPMTPEELHRIFAPFPREGMDTYVVSDRVNNPAVDDARVIEPVKGL